MIDSNVLFLSFILQSLNTEEHTDKTLCSRKHYLNALCIDNYIHILSVTDLIIL